MEQTMENVKTRYEEACESFGVSPDMDESMPLGKFEGEPKEILYWESLRMDGFSEESGETWNAFPVFPAERAFFGLPEDTAYAVLHYSEQGFVSLEYGTEDEFRASQDREDAEEEDAENC